MKPLLALLALLLAAAVLVVVFVFDPFGSPPPEPTLAPAAAERAGQGRQRPNRRDPPRDIPAVEEPAAPVVDRFVEETGKPATGLAGAVYTPAGNPLPEAVVTVFREDPGATLLRPVRLRVKEPVATDAGGRFQVTALAGGPGYVIRVEHPSYAPLERAGLEVQQDRVRAIPDLHMKGGVTIHGVVTRAGGAPLADAVVALNDAVDRAGTVVQVLTGADGAYRFANATPGIYEVSVKADGMQSLHSPVLYAMNPRDAVRHDFALEAGIRLEGRVTTADGEPLPGAVIHVVRQRGGARSEGTSTSRADGAFVIEGLAEDAYRLVAERKGFVPVNRANVEPSRRIQIQMARTAGVTGFVVDVADQPIDKFWLRVWRINPAGRPAGPLGEFLPVKSADGSFTVEDLTPGRYAIQAFADGFAPAFSRWFAVRDLYVHGVRVRLDPGASLAGTVVDTSGRAMEGAIVRLFANNYRDIPHADLLFGDHNRLGSTKSDEAGRFEFRGLAGGLYQLRLTAKGMMELSVIDVEVKDDQGNECGPYTLGEGGHLEGTVVGTSSVPANGATVTVTSPTDGVVRKVQADDGGGFTVRNLPPGTYRLTAVTTTPASGFQDVLAQALQSAHRAVEVTVAEGQTQPVTLYVNS